jgi:DNA-binding transcriptional MerR regulator
VPLAEYRLAELAQISGVSARNIRAYRERGLLDPPRRVGRSAFYDDYHLSQLRTINQLLRRGFNSAHIAEFLTSMRQGADLADILGIQRAMLGEDSSPVTRQSIDVEADSDEARRLTEYGLTEVIDGAVVPVDQRIAQIIARAPDHTHSARTVLRIHESTRQAIDRLAREFVRLLDDGAVVEDDRELWMYVVTDGLDRAVRQQMVSLLRGPRPD